MAPHRIRWYWITIDHPLIALKNTYSTTDQNHHGIHHASPTKAPVNPYHHQIILHHIIQGGAPKIAKLVYNSDNYGLFLYVYIYMNTYKYIYIDREREAIYLYIEAIYLYSMGCIHEFITGHHLVRGLFIQSPFGSRQLWPWLSVLSDNETMGYIW